MMWCLNSIRPMPNSVYILTLAKCHNRAVQKRAGIQNAIIIVSASLLLTGSLTILELLRSTTYRWWNILLASDHDSNTFLKVKCCIIKIPFFLIVSLNHEMHIINDHQVRWILHFSLKQVLWSMFARVRVSAKPNGSLSEIKWFISKKEGERPNNPEPLQKDNA